MQILGQCIQIKRILNKLAPHMWDEYIAMRRHCLDTQISALGDVFGMNVKQKQGKEDHEKQGRTNADERTSGQNKVDGSNKRPRPLKAPIASRLATQEHGLMVNGN